MFVCEEDPLPLVENCLLGLMKNRDTCDKIRVRMQETLVQQIGSGDLLIPTSGRLEAHNQCNETGILQVNETLYSG